MEFASLAVSRVDALKRERAEGYCQRKNIYLPNRQFGIELTLITHGFFGSN
jgi:hypothetical protein